MSNRKIILSAILLGVIFLYIGFGNLSLRRELKQTRAALSLETTNKKILEFTNFFIDDVLRADSEVNFETRLKLENIVRDLGNDAILAQWQKFVESRTESQAQTEVKNLLQVLISEIH